MRFVSIEREISTSLNIGNFESIKPTLRVCGALEEGEDLATARRALDAVLKKEFDIVVLEELRAVSRRREAMATVNMKDPAQVLAGQIAAFKADASR